MTAPPVPSDGDLRDFPKMLIDRRRLFASEFHIKASDSEWRAGVTLWLKSWDQVPAGSLPNDDLELCRLAELGRDLKTWRKLKPMALHRWEPADDGRLYHNTVAEVTNDALHRKERQRTRTSKATAASVASRRNVERNVKRNGDVTLSITDAKNSRNGDVTSTKEREEGMDVDEICQRPGREPNGSLPPPLPPLPGGDRARARGRGRKSAENSPRMIQAQAFFEVANERSPDRNC